MLRRGATRPSPDHQWRGDEQCEYRRAGGFRNRRDGFEIRVCLLLALTILSRQQTEIDQIDVAVEVEIAVLPDGFGRSAVVAREDAEIDEIDIAVKIGVAGTGAGSHRNALDAVCQTIGECYIAVVVGTS